MASLKWEPSMTRDGCSESAAGHVLKPETLFSVHFEVRPRAANVGKRRQTAANGSKRRQMAANGGKWRLSAFMNRQQLWQERSCARETRFVVAFLERLAAARLNETSPKRDHLQSLSPFCAAAAAALHSAGEQTN